MKLYIELYWYLGSDSAAMLVNARPEVHWTSMVVTALVERGIERCIFVAGEAVWYRFMMIETKWMSAVCARSVR